MMRKVFLMFKLPNQKNKKVSNSDVREAVSKVNEGQMAFKEPGWAKVAGAAHKVAMGPLSKMMKKKGGGAPESESMSKGSDAAKGPQGKDFKIEEDPEIGPQGEMAKPYKFGSL